jgi:hypothetical protein
MNPSKKIRLAILEQHISGNDNDIYALSIKARVAEKIGDKESKKQAVEALEKCEKIADEYLAIKSEIDAEIE